MSVGLENRRSVTRTPIGLFSVWHQFQRLYNYVRHTMDSFQELTLDWTYSAAMFSFFLWRLSLTLSKMSSVEDEQVQVK